MRLAFTKMHGLGNDFMVIDGVTQEVRLTPAQVRAWADRHFGIGFDQLLLVEPPQAPDVDFNYRIFNADGAEVSQCGNGARCFAAFVYRQRLIHKTDMSVATRAGRMLLTLLEPERVQVNMGVPELVAERVPFTGLGDSPEQRVRLDDGREVSLTAVSMGNPHAVLLLDQPPTDAMVAELGPLLERHPSFPERANVGFLYVEQADRAQLRVFERGVGETLACGSGACAALVAGRLRGVLGDTVRLTLLGGPLDVSWAGGKEPVMMTGPVAFVYDGYIELEQE